MRFDQSQGSIDWRQNFSSQSKIANHESLVVSVEHKKMGNGRKAGDTDLVKSFLHRVPSALSRTIDLGQAQRDFQVQQVVKELQIWHILHESLTTAANGIRK